MPDPCTLGGQDHNALPGSIQIVAPRTKPRLTMDKSAVSAGVLGFRLGRTVKPVGGSLATHPASQFRLKTRKGGDVGSGRFANMSRGANRSQNQMNRNVTWVKSQMANADKETQDSVSKSLSEANFTNNEKHSNSQLDVIARSTSPREIEIPPLHVGSATSSLVPTRDEKKL